MPFNQRAKPKQMNETLIFFNGYLRTHYIYSSEFAISRNIAETPLLIWCKVVLLYFFEDISPPQILTPKWTFSFEKQE